MYDFPFDWCAIFDGVIIGDTSSEALLEKIREKVEDKDIDSIFQTYISKLWYYLNKSYYRRQKLKLSIIFLTSYPILLMYGYEPGYIFISVGWIA